MNILALWPIIKWVLQALGFMGPEDREKERDFKLRLLEAQERKDEALIRAFAEFQGGQNLLLKTFQVVVLVALYYDIIWGERKAVSAAVDLSTAGIPGLLIMAIMLFPFYGPALVSGVNAAFQASVDAVAARRNGGGKERTVETPTREDDSQNTRISPPPTRPFSKESGYRGRVDPPDDHPGLEG